MSYCRWSDGDVYAYDGEGGVHFYVVQDGLNCICNTYNEAYQYAKELRDVHKIKIPDYAIESLKEDAREEVKRYAGSVVTELLDENEKLRELILDIRKCSLLNCELCDATSIDKSDGCIFTNPERFNGLGIEVD